jgi:CxxC-x17-CxxC domain-containing protein
MMKSFSKASKFGKREFGRSERRDSDRPRRRESGRSEYGRPDRRDMGRSSYGARRAPLEMHEVVCDKCGKTCEVPFKPTTNKPVYCRECFNKNDSSESRGESRSRSDDFRPRGKPERQNRSRSSNTFAPKPGELDHNTNVSQEELDKLNEKLDKIMKALNIE